MAAQQRLATVARHFLPRRDPHAPAPAPAAASTSRPVVVEEGWGDTGDGGRMAVEAGKEVQLLTLTHGTTGMSASIMTLGCILVDLHVADGSGRRDDSSNVVLGFDSLQRYLDGHPAFGALCGRVAGRIANSSLPDGTALSANSGPHHLHGGVQGFMAKVWNAEIASQDPEAPAVRLSYVSEAGEEGYPGTLTTSCTYTLTAANGLRIDYSAEVAGAATPVNLTNHTYFNLAGRDAARSADVGDHTLEIAAAQTTGIDGDNIPTGEVLPLPEVIDFRSAKPLGPGIEAFSTDEARGGGIDHYYFFDDDAEDGGMRRGVARLAHKSRTMEVDTTEPGLNLYSANGLNRKNFGYVRHGAICLETQRPPDAVHHDHFPSIMLEPGEVWESTTEYRFSS